MPVDRHINFFEIQKACDKPGCPLCTIVSERAIRYLDNMLFEHVSDRGFRKAHRQAGGFCAFHSQNLESFRDGLAVAILCRDILEDRIESFKKHKAWKPKGVCPVCVEQDHIERDYLSFLAEADTELFSPQSNEEGDNSRELQHIVTNSDGLCAPHYARLLETTKHIPKWLTEFHEHKFTEMLRRISQFIELSAYGRQSEFASLSDRDKLVWKELSVNLRQGE